MVDVALTLGTQVVTVQIDGVPTSIVVGENTADAARSAAAAAASALAAATVAGAIKIVDAVPAYVPILLDEASNVPLWLDGGLIDAPGIGPRLSAVVDSTVRAIAPLQTVSTGNAKVPLFVDDTGNVPLWLDEGKLAAAGVATSMLTAIQGEFANQLPITTDGRSLRAFRRKRAKFLAGNATRFRVALIGDSWIQYRPIAAALDALLVADTQQSGPGWIGVDTAYGTLNASLAHSGWTLYDMTDTHGVGPTRGCGPDGFAISATGTTATLSVSAVTCTEFTIYYWNGNGTFRYRVDGGSWIAVAGTGANAHAKVSLTGLSNAVHTIDIDLTGNTGTVALHGFRAERAAVGGLVFHRLGNASAEGLDFTTIKTDFGYFTADLAIDAAVILLGNNDFRNQRNAAELVAGVQDIIDRLPAGAGVVLIAIPETGESHTIPLSIYRDALRNLAVSGGFEFIDLMREWDTYAVENAAGSWVDPAHVTGTTTDANGSGRRIAESIFRNFFNR